MSNADRPPAATEPSVTTRWTRVRRLAAPVAALALLGIADAAGCKRPLEETTLEPRALANVHVFQGEDGEVQMPVVAAHPVRAKNVILLTVDAFRADQPWVGYQGVQTPHLSRFADESIVYERMYSVANTTTPSLAGILSSRYPSELPRDTCSLAGFHYDDGLPRVLQGAGVHTFAAHGHAIFASAFAPSEGFLDWKLVDNAGGRLASDGAVTGEEIAALVATFVKAEATGKAFFVWAHFVDPHDRYVAHADFPATSSGPRGLYDGEVAYTDDAIGRVLSAIDDAGLRDRTAVIITADHGESFGEHGRYRHGFTVYEEEVHVPLLVRIPGVKARRETVRRSGIDLAPTVAALMGVAAPASWRGTSLLADLGADEPEERVVMIDTPELKTSLAQRAVLDGAFKTIPHGDHSSTVFDLSADPEEKTPLHGPEASEATARALTELRRIHSIPPETCQRDGSGS